MADRGPAPLGSGLSRPNLNLDDSNRWRRSRYGRLEMQFQRLFEIIQGFRRRKGMLHEYRCVTGRPDGARPPLIAATKCTSLDVPTFSSSPSGLTSPSIATE